MSFPESDELCRDPKLQSVMLALFPSLLRRAFAPADMVKLAAWLRGGLKSQFASQELDELFQAAAAECWVLFLSRPEALNPVFAEAMNDLLEGYLDYGDLAQRLCQQIVGLFRSRVLDENRDKDYAGLREAITRVKMSNNEPAFATIIGSYGLAYAPVGRCARKRPMEPANLTRFPFAIQPPACSIRKAKKLSDQFGEEITQSVWDWARIEKEATRFWQAFVDYHYQGEAVYVPLFAFYCWLRAFFNLGAPGECSLEAENERGESLAYALPDAANVEEEIWLLEIRHLAADFVELLPQREAELCALLYGEDSMSMRGAAQSLGLAGVSSVALIKKSLLEHMWLFKNLYPDLASDRDHFKIFVMEVRDLCKKRAPTPTKDMTGQKWHGE